jgi:hypothetical protein
MAGLAGQSIGLSGATNKGIAPVSAAAAGTTTCRGCIEQVIGFGEGSSVKVQTEDFNATDDTVTIGLATAAAREPVYTNGVLTWVDPDAE